MFGSLEIRTNATKGLGEWNRYLRSVAAERPLYVSCDRGAASCPSPLKSWRQQIRQWQGLGEQARIEAVNSWVNARIRWRDDRAASGKADRWATPAQALKGIGDCEDYALLKYESLRALGLDESRLRIVIVQDTRKGIGHAVLAVHSQAGILILDNQSSRVRRHDQIAHYAPVYSINQAGRWINIATRKIRTEYVSARKIGADPALVQTVVPAADTPRTEAAAFATLGK